VIKAPEAEESEIGDLVPYYKDMHMINEKPTIYIPTIHASRQPMK
jgi:hypothetical protein